jgi:PKD repeat protein
MSAAPPPAQNRSKILRIGEWLTLGNSVITYSNRVSKREQDMKLCLPVMMALVVALGLCTCSQKKSDSTAPTTPIVRLKADFRAVPRSGSAPLTVQFTDLSTSKLGIATWSWDFGDGGTSTEQNPMYGYTAAGVYTVALTITGPEGSDTATKANHVSVSAPAGDIAAGFTALPSSGVKPLSVQFTDISTSVSGITSWSWDFGDGGTSTLQFPLYEYVTEGTYDVSLTVSGLDGSDTETKTAFIQVYASGEITASFFATPPSGDVPLEVWFTDTSLATSGITSWSWVFGDGGTSTEQFPNYTYNSAGKYTVSLTVSGPDGSDTKTVADCITVNALTGGAPELDISQWVQGGPYTIAGLEGKVIFLNFTSPST